MLNVCMVGSEGRPPLASGPSVLPAMRVLQAVQAQWDAQYGAGPIPGRDLNRV
jgi:2-hydroxy-4-carboxymuconate semialdehyde hemiacetal dehydrogenase